MRHPRRLLAPFAALFIAACTQAPAPPPAVPETKTSADINTDFGAVSVDVVPPPKKKIDIAKTTEWPDAKLESGKASISCSTDYLIDGDGKEFSDLSFFSVLDAMLPCKDVGVVRVRYHGRIAGDFTTMMERVTAMAKRMGIQKRILDLDSSGGQVEDAIRAGDAIGDAGWTMWVREGAVCHSACVLLLAGGDDRVISGAVGVHRIIRIQSQASSRTELSQELHEVHESMKAYLARNGAGVAVADFMMTVPNRSLRLLTPEELAAFGLSGRNAAQEDLDRIRLVRMCGLEFVRREDLFLRAFERECRQPGKTVEEINSCGLALRPRYGFPDAKCADESPLAELDKQARNQAEDDVDVVVDPEPSKSDPIVR